MAGLRNSLRSLPSSSVVGLIAVGDAACHSDPVMALGLSFALVHAAELASALREHSRIEDAAGRFHERTRPLMRERFEFATLLDEQRLRMWTGGGVDVTSRTGNYELFSLVAGGVAALQDPDIFRAHIRRTGLLESNEVLDGDLPLQQRIEDIFRNAMSAPRPRSGPTQSEMQLITEAALAGTGPVDG